MTYPGEVKITVIRETRSVSDAKESLRQARRAVIENGVRKVFSVPFSHMGCIGAGRCCDVIRGEGIP